jgi:hypothetical protein
MDKVHTINQPNGKPYISIIEEEAIIKLHLHTYDNNFDSPIYLSIDKRAVHHLINALGKVSIKGIEL